MANLKVVDADVLEADLTSVADSIRAKTGGEDALSFPSGFVDALDTIESADSALAEVESILSGGYVNYSYLFYNMQRLLTVPMAIIQHIEQGKYFDYMFYNCSMITNIPKLNTSNGETFNSIFYGVTQVHTIEGIDFSSATKVTNAFINCPKLEYLTVNGVIKITGLNLSQSSKLTHDSLMSVINALFDHKTAGTSGTFTLTLGSTNLAKLTDAEKAIATQRGWTLA